MSKISQLTAVASLGSADQFPLGSAANGDDMRVSLSMILDYMQANIVQPSYALTPQYAVPLTGATVTVSAANTWLILSPAGTLAALTIALPAIRTAGQEVLIMSSQILTSLTVSGAGTTVVGAPTTLAANGFARMKYDGVLNAWYRVG